MSDLALAELAEVNPAVRIPRDLSADDGVSFIPMSDVSESGRWTIKQVRPLKAISAGFTAFEEGDVLVAKITPCFENGKGGHATNLENGVGFGSTEFHVLRARSGSTPRFIFQLTQWRRFRHAAEGKMVGSAGQRRVPRAFFDEFLVTSFSPEEQSKIAAVLDTLDTAIHETEAIIAKLKAVKQGLLHDLLTRGIDANGELRPPQVEAAHLYKQSPLGWIPKEWEWCQAGSVLTGIEAGNSPDCQDVPATGDQWGVLKVGAVHPDGLRLHENKVIERASLKNPSYLVRDGDLLLSRANTFELVGFVCHVTNSPRNLMLSDKTLRLCVNSGRMLTRFLFWQLQHAKSRTQIETAATGTSGSMKNISQSEVERIKLARPPRHEQGEIDDRVTASARRYEAELDQLGKLGRLKSGLMDDLLTGRVRVTPLLHDAVP